jgi:hypothetical protein
VITERFSARDVTAADVTDLITTHQAELNELEYKQVSDSDLLKAACAIANSGGGFIVVGMAEDADHCASAIVNVERPQQTADRIRQKLRDGLSPRPSIEVVPLRVDSENVIIIRIAPQNPPHMISSDKRTDFFGRYDATSERMRYEEIEQRFRDKFGQGEPLISETPRALLETLSGRREVSTGTAGALDQYIRTFTDARQPTLGLIAVQDSISSSVSEETATRFFSDPSYERKAGWLVVHPTLSITPQGGRWLQDYANVSHTYINSSGDVLFQKAVDEVLCWKQSEIDFERCPRMYSNAIIEYCLSFIYSVSDIAAITKPEAILMTALLVVGSEGVQLPLGEGGSVWYDAPAVAPVVRKDTARAVPLLVDMRGPVHVRREAFKLAAQIYAFFGYSETQVPFSDRGAITFEANTEQSAVAAARSYLQGRLGVTVEYAGEEFDRSIYWFRFTLPGSPRRISMGFSDIFFDDIATNEDVFFKLLDAEEIEDALRAWTASNKPVMTTHGIIFVE